MQLPISPTAAHRQLGCREIFAWEWASLKRQVGNGSSSGAIRKLGGPASPPKQARRLDLMSGTVEKHSKAAHCRAQRTVTTSPRVLGCVLLAGTLLAIAFLTHAQARRAERRRPAQGRFAHIEGVDLHFVDRGKGPTVVLLHGNGAMIQDFEASGILDLLARQYRVV